MRNNRRGIAAIFRVIAGGYLVYLGVQLIKDGLLTGEMQGTARVWGTVASIAFIVFGIIFAIHAILFMGKMRQEEEAEEAQEAEEITEVEAEPEPAEEVKAPSLFDRARVPLSDENEDDNETEI